MPFHFSTKNASRLIKHRYGSRSDLLSVFLSTTGEVGRASRSKFYTNVVTGLSTEYLSLWAYPKFTGSSTSATLKNSHIYDIIDFSAPVPYTKMCRIMLRVYSLNMMLFRFGAVLYILEKYYIKELLIC